MDRLLLLAMFTGAFLATSCHDHPHDRAAASADDDKPIYINGASTVGHVIPDLVQGFLKEPGNESVRFVYPQGPGSETIMSPLDAKAPRGNRVWETWQGSTWGLTLLHSGEVTIGAMARRPSATELDKARTGGANPKLHVIAYDAVALLVHPARSSVVACLTRAHLRSIYLSGEKVMWSDLGQGLPDRPVRALGSNPAICGTAMAFAEVIDPETTRARKAGELFDPGVKFCALADIVNAVLADEWSIGFVQYALLPKETRVHVVAYLDEDNPEMTQPVRPSVDTCSNGTYSLQRPLILLTNGIARGATNRFLRFVLGPQGQEILRNRSCIVPRQ
jgi:phosphate transport system substrate-binding protein